MLEERKSANPQTSYVAKLYAKGMDSILKKVGEEAAETIIAAGWELQELTPVKKSMEDIFIALTLNSDL